MNASRRHLSRLAPCALLAGLVVGGAWIAIDDSEDRRTPVASERVADAESIRVERVELATAEFETVDLEAVELESATDDASDSQRTVAAAQPSAGAKPLISAKSRLASEDVGRLVVRAVDAATGVPITNVRVRAMNFARFADRRGDSAADTILRLEPGVYALRVMAAGFEATELPSAQVLAQQTNVLKPIELLRGTGTVFGRAEGARANVPLYAELFGEGRNSCGDCQGLPCSRCGYTPDFTSIALGQGGEFMFGRLASAVYLVRIVDGHRREWGAPVRVDLGAGETRHVVLDLASTRSVRVALTDADGTSLAEVFAARIAAGTDDSYAIPPLEDGQRARVLVWDCRIRSGREVVGVGDFTPPTPAGKSWYSSRVFSGTKVGGRSRDDRARQAGDGLQPVPLVPSIRFASLEPVVDEHGMVCFENLPARADALEMRCGPFLAATMLDDSETGVRHVRIELDPAKNTEGAPHSFLALESSR